VVLRLFHEGTHACSFLLEGLGRNVTNSVCSWLLCSAARGAPPASIVQLSTEVPAIPTIAYVRIFRLLDAKTKEDDAQNEDRPTDSNHNGHLAVGMMFLGTKLAREWLTQTLVEVCAQVWHRRIVKKCTTIADTMASELLCLDRFRITRRWFCRQGLKERNLLYITEAKDFAIVCQAHAILWSNFHEVFLHVQVDVVFALEGFTGIVAHPLGNLGPTFGSSLILLMPTEDINPRAEGTSIWPDLRCVNPFNTVWLPHYMRMETLAHSA